VSIDGKPSGLSRSVFTSVHARDRVDGAYPLCDVSWIDTSANVNPLNVGHIVNNAACSTEANVTYHEVDLRPKEFDPRLRLFLPNARYNTLEDGGEERMRLRLVPIIALRDVEAGEELFSSYFSMVD
jgi:hypothetical protein